MNLFLQQLGAAARIGWENESNWTRRWVYVLYAAVRPLALCTTLYFIYRAVAAQPSRSAGFLAVYVGSAFFTMVTTVTASASWVIIDDREHFQLIRYVYMAPMRFAVYVLGRTAPVLAVSVSSLVLILAFGRLALALPLAPDWALLIPTLLLGLAATAALGILFAGFVLVTARHSLLLAEGSGTVFLLVCGVMYPIDVMPPWLLPLSRVLPMTYWMELVRRSFGAEGFSPVLTPLGTASAALIFALSTAGLFLFAFAVFAAMERAAKRAGTLDRTTNY